MNNKINYDHYCVAFVDLLGQKEFFLENGKYIDTIDEIVANEGEYIERIKKAHNKTVVPIKRLRKQFKEFFDAYLEEAAISVNIPKNKEKLFLEMRKSTDVEIEVFSDCILIYSILKPKKHYSEVINCVYGIITACGGLMLSFLADRKPFRVGIDVGIATKMFDKEIYGPALFRAYDLESKKADFPRIMIGEQVMQFLGNLIHENQQIDKQIPEDIKWCKIMAENSWKMIRKDANSDLYLHYLGEHLISSISKNVGMGNIKMLYNRAKEFANEEHQRFSELGNSKIASKYQKLMQYLDACKIKI